MKQPTLLWKQTIILWSIAFILTAASAIYQRMTGPTYPLSGTVILDGKTIGYTLLRSHVTDFDAPVSVKVDDPDVKGVIRWKRFKTDDPTSEIAMAMKDGVLSGDLPKQPAAGKLQDHVLLSKGNSSITVPPIHEVVIRFKGDVPSIIIILHVIAMFGGMLLSTRSGLEFFRKEPKFKKLILWTLAFLVAGGFVLGPIVQKYAFDAYWTGWPIGHDLTDNKTAAAIIAWVVALIMVKKAKNPKNWAIGAAIITIIVYLIPHSVLGSELDYKAIDQQKKVENVRTE